MTVPVPLQLSQAMYVEGTHVLTITTETGHWVA